MVQAVAEIPTPKYGVKSALRRGEQSMTTIQPTNRLQDICLNRQAVAVRRFTGVHRHKDTITGIFKVTWRRLPGARFHYFKH